MPLTVLIFHNNIKKRVKVKINLWGIENIALLIIENENSPVKYSNQTNGYACSHPEIRGYLIPIEFKGNILNKFLNFGYKGSGWELDISFYDDVPEIIKQLNDYFGEKYNFELDKSKIENNTESWIHLIGRQNESNKPENVFDIIQEFPNKFNAILTWPNSD
jgi:hypothetical protein